MAKFRTTEWEKTDGKFICPDCGREFNRATSAANHYRMVHTSTGAEIQLKIQQEKTAGFFRKGICSHCGKEVSIVNLKRHESACLKKSAVSSSKPAKKSAREVYKQNPNHCKECGKPIKLRLDERPTDARQRKFCNRKCAATYNNHRRIRTPWSEESRLRLSKKMTTKEEPKRRKGFLTSESSGKCENCKKDISYKQRENCDRKTPRYWKRFYCQDCVGKARARTAHKNGFIEMYPWDSWTKKDLKDSQGGDPGRTKMLLGRHAKRIYDQEHGHRECTRCGFPQATVSHKMAVADFSDDALIVEINAPSNLQGLCPNCHWMWDRGYLTENNFHLSNDEILKSRKVSQKSS